MPVIISYTEIFTLTTAAGINTFSQKEYVFQNDSKVSELTWDCPIIPYIELGVLSRLHNFEFNLSYATVIPIKSGTLKDLDFNSTDISQYSSHNLYVDKKYAFTFQAGYNFSSKNLFFFPFATFCYKNQKFSGRDGYYQYPETGIWTGNETKTNLKGNVISYESEFFIFGIGLSTAVTSKNFTVKLIGVLNPYIKGNAIDSHYMRKKQFYDSFDGKFGFSLSSEFYYKKIFLRLSYNHIPLLKGSTADNVIGVSNSDFLEQKNFQGGTCLDSFSLSLGGKI